MGKSKHPKEPAAEAGGVRPGAGDPAQASEPDRLPNIVGIVLLPPLAVARLGGSDTPLDCFTWREDPTIHGAAKTVIEPDLTLVVVADGSVRPTLPGAIRFRDGDHFRPVAPFFEVWVRLRFPDTQEEWEEPLTTGLLDRFGLSTASLSYVVTAANRKAARRTHDDTNAFVARVEITGDDHVPYPLKAWTPRRPGTKPLVPEDAPIILGQVQVIKPLPYIRLFEGALPQPCKEMGVNLSALRLRFTPGRGRVYGPPTASSSEAPVDGRVYPVVPDPNDRHLNPDATWLSYDYGLTRYESPSPANTYDGADATTDQSLGIVDDTCDAIIEATLVDRSLERFRAMARVVCSPPDFAPDRRPFLSLADDLADRELPLFSREVPPAPPPGRLQQLCELLFHAPDSADQAAGHDIQDVAERARFQSALQYYRSLVHQVQPPKPIANLTDEELAALLEAMRFDDLLFRIADLFQRVVETVGQINLDAIRTRAVQENARRGAAGPAGALPATDDTSMTPADPLAVKRKEQGTSFPGVPLPYSALARTVHAPLADIDPLFDFLSANEKRIKDLIRPPYGRVRELKSQVESGDAVAPGHRDPRVRRDTVHDMRMPPYMRDSDGGPLSLTRRQYDELMALVAHLTGGTAAGAEAVAVPDAATRGLGPAAGRLIQSPLRRRIEEVVRRLTADDSSDPVPKQRP